MEISDRFIEKFRKHIASDKGLAALTAKELPLSGFEVPATRVYGTGIDPADTRATQIDIHYRDDNPPETEQWETDPNKIVTFFIPKKDKNDIDQCGYLFGTVLHPEDCVAWYRWKHGYATRFAEPEDEAVDKE